MFKPINLPPSEHHQFATGHSTEFGDNARAVGEKINAGFKHVYGLLAKAGHKIEDAADEEKVALVARVTELEAELRNVKMMVQRLGFAGAKPVVSITDPSHSIGFTHPTELMTGAAASAEPVVTIIDPSTHTATGMSWGGLTAEPVVTVSEKEAPQS
jgi:hypothetical protein